MVYRAQTLLCCITMLAIVSFFRTAHAQANPFTKAQVGDRIRKVEDGVDEFRKYLENRGEDARNRADSAKSSGATRRRGGSSSANTDAKADRANQAKDDLEDAMSCAHSKELRSSSRQNCAHERIHCPWALQSDLAI